MSKIVNKKKKNNNHNQSLKNRLVVWFNNYQKEHQLIKKLTIKNIHQYQKDYAFFHQQAKKKTIKSLHQAKQNFVAQHQLYQKLTTKYLRNKISKARNWFLSHQSKIYLTTLIIGIVLTAVGTFLMLYQKTILSFKVSPTVIAQANLRASEPKKILIPNQNIDLEIIPATIKDGVWETSDDKATHLASSMRPKEGGNIVIYGHNRKKIFGSLLDVSRGQIITLVNNDNEKFDYQVTQIQIVNPDQIEMVLPTDHEELTVYTCTGWFDSKRLVIKAQPLSSL